MEAKKFAKIDKEWAKVMSKAFDTQLVVESAANEILRAVSVLIMSAFVFLYNAIGGCFMSYTSDVYTVLIYMYLIVIYQLGLLFLFALPAYLLLNVIHFLFSLCSYFLHLSLIST